MNLEAARQKFGCVMNLPPWLPISNTFILYHRHLITTDVILPIFLPRLQWLFTSAYSLPTLYSHLDTLEPRIEKSQLRENFLPRGSERGHGRYKSYKRNFAGEHEDVDVGFGVE